MLEPPIYFSDDDRAPVGQAEIVIQRAAMKGTMDERFQAILDGLPPKPSPELLEPFRELIREMRRSGRRAGRLRTLSRKNARCRRTLARFTILRAYTVTENRRERPCSRSMMLRP